LGIYNKIHLQQAWIQAQKYNENTTHKPCAKGTCKAKHAMFKNFKSLMWFENPPLKIISQRPNNQNGVHIWTSSELKHN
jgi:hypothetical protein